VRAFIRGSPIAYRKPASIPLGLGAFHSFWLYKAALTSASVALASDSRGLWNVSSVKERSSILLRSASVYG
jgi:hypothetical protein